MGTVLEVGKILTTVWLHQNWRRAPFVIKSYLTTAVIVLMFITSMGVFGFLSKSHIEQSAMGTEQIAQAEVIDSKIARQQAKIERWTVEIERLNTGGGSQRLDGLIEREQQRIEDANARIQPQIDAENAKIPALREQAAAEVEQQNKRLAQAQTRAADAISVAQAELDRLDADVLAYTKLGVQKGGAFSKDIDNVAKGAELRKQQQPQRSKLQKDIDTAKANELSVASKVQREITNINSRLDEKIREVEGRIAEIRQSIESTVQQANENIAKYTAEAGNSNEDTDQRIVQLETNIETAQTTVDNLREDKFAFEKEYRVFEAEVGPVKYIAELIYGEADRNQLEEAVRWVIIIIVAVFDPLAVCLVLAGVMSIGWWRQERGLNKPKQKIVRVQDPRLEELEMELKKHNDYLSEIEKLLDGNLANVDPAKHAELTAERDRLLAERDELAMAIADMKAESDGLVDKVVATEAERDEYKRKLDEIAQGVSGQETRITELLSKIADLEAEIERRDAVVIKMAEKYQLVEKDSFGDDLVSDAMPTPVERDEDATINIPPKRDE
jgi:chromosome segregation ATPase